MIKRLIAIVIAVLAVSSVHAEKKQFSRNVYYDDALSTAQQVQAELDLTYTMDRVIVLSDAKASNREIQLAGAENRSWVTLSALARKYGFAYEYLPDNYMLLCGKTDDPAVFRFMLVQKF